MEVSIEQKRSSHVAVGQMNTIAGSSSHLVVLVEVCKGRWRHDVRRTDQLGCESGSGSTEKKEGGGLKAV
jgi:hypothetical protein